MTSLTAILTVTLIYSAAAWTEDLLFTDCSSVYDVNDDKTYQIQWIGDDLRYTCDLSLHGYDEDKIENEYKICIQASTWNVTDSNVYLTYYTDDNLQMTYSQDDWSSPTTQWCSGSDDYVYIQLVTSSSLQNQGHITLQVTAVMTYNYYSFIDWTVGGTIGGIAVIIIIIVVVVAVSRRRRIVTGRRVYTTPNISGQTIIPQYDSQQMAGGFENPGYITGPAPPPYYPPTTSQGVQSPPPYQQQPTEQPTAGVHQKY